MTETAPDWLRERERGSVLALRLMSLIARGAPPILSDPLIWLVSLYYTAFPTDAAHTGSTRYLRAVLGREPGFRERHRQVRTFAHAVFDRVRLLAGGVEGFTFHPRNQEIVERRNDERRGGVLLGAHFGSFEALRAFDRTLPSLSVRYLMFQGNATKTTEILEKVNPDVADQVIPLSDGATAMLTVRQEIEAGHFVAFLGDRLPVRNPRAEIEVDFLGGRIRIPRAPYLAAILAGVPLILCFSPRVGRRTYDVEFCEIYDGRPVARGERDATCAELAQRYADALAEMCRRHPYNWFNFFDIWR